MRKKCWLGGQEEGLCWAQLDLGGPSAPRPVSLWGCGGTGRSTSKGPSYPEGLAHGSAIPVPLACSVSCCVWQRQWGLGNARRGGEQGAACGAGGQGPGTGPGGGRSGRDTVSLVPGPRCGGDGEFEAERSPQTSAPSSRGGPNRRGHFCCHARWPSDGATPAARRGDPECGRRERSPPEAADGDVAGTRALAPDPPGPRQRARRPFRGGVCVSASGPRSTPGRGFCLGGQRGSHTVQALLLQPRRPAGVRGASGAGGRSLHTKAYRVHFTGKRDTDEFVFVDLPSDPNRSGRAQPRAARPESGSRRGTSSDVLGPAVAAKLVPVPAGPSGDWPVVMTAVDSQHPRKPGAGVF